MDLFGDLDGPEVGGDERLLAVVEEIRAYASGPPPEVRPALLAVFTHGLAAHPDVFAPPIAPPASTPRRRLAHRLGTARARLALGVAVGSITVFSTGAAGALPDPAQSAFERVASAVGIDLPEEVRGPDDAPGPADAPLVPAGRDQQADEAKRDGAGSPRGTEPSVPPGDDRGGDPANRDAGDPEGSPGGTGREGDRGRVPERVGGDRGLDQRPVPTPGAPGAPGLSDGGRPGDMPGLGGDDDDEQDEEGPERPKAPAGELPPNTAAGAEAPAGAGRREASPPR